MIAARRGMSLVEVMVVIAIVLVLGAIMIPALSSFLSLEQQRTAQELATSYAYLRDDASLKNLTYRVAFHVDEGFYEIQAGSPDALIFDDPEKRAEWEADRDARLRAFSEEERASAAQAEQGDWSLFGGGSSGGGGVEGGNLPVVHSDVRARRQLPSGTVFGGVWTPQYKEMVRPDERAAEKDGPRVVYSHVFANGFSEPTLVQLVNADDPESGYTLFVEPLSGKVQLVGEVKEPDDFQEDVPDEAPELP